MLPRAYHSVGAGQARGRCGTAGSHPDSGGGTEGAAHLAGGEAHADSVVPSRRRDLHRLPPPLLRRRWTRWRALRHKHSTSLGHAGQDHLPHALCGSILCLALLAVVIYERETSRLLLFYCVLLISLQVIG